jgi:hypothetical protein
MMESPTKHIWEGTSTHELLVMLIGYEMGRYPENHLDAIRDWRGNIIEYFDRCFLKLTGTEAALEIGSGCGFTSRALARRVARLHCLDVSDSFLAFARHECADVSNVSFHRGTYIDLDTIPPQSIDVVLASAVLFRQHAQEYRLEPTKYEELCKWNSGVAVRRIARAHGFAAAVFHQRGCSNAVLLAVRGRKSSSALKLETTLRVKRFELTHPRSFLVPEAPVEQR